MHDATTRLRALMLCYYFPPKGGAGVQRSTTFVKHLPDFGVDPVVVTGAATSQGEWEPLDSSLADGLPADLPVLRPADTVLPTDTSSRAERWLLRPTAFDRWWSERAVSLGLEAAREARPDVLYASLSPFSSWTAAVELGRRLDVPVVADLRDPWALDEVQVYPTQLHRALVLRRMDTLVRQSALTIWNTPEAQRVAREAFPGTPAARHAVLTNGYDGGDFQGPPPPFDPTTFRVVHSGTLHASLAAATARRGAIARALGGQLSTPDHFGRTPRYLLEALRRVPAASADGRRIELHLYGGLSADDQRLLAEYPDVSVRRHGFVDHDQVIMAVRGADLLFLPLYGLPPGHRARIVPGKTYEYLASARPILAAVPPSDVRDFVLAAGAGSVADPQDVAGLAHAVGHWLERAPAPNRPLGPNVLRFERRELTRSLAELMRSATR
jgi:glycosyltransferase involved in cell wall biosynthesis